MTKQPLTRSEKKFLVTDKSTDLIECTSQAPNCHRKRKRKVSSRIDESASHKTKQNKIELKAMDQRSDSTDLISQLPEHIIHHILSLLRCGKDAARTSILSKRWRDIWASYLILEFDQRKFQKQERKLYYRSKRLYQRIKKRKDAAIKMKNEMFLNFVDGTLQSRIEQKSSIQKFMLHLTSYNLELSDLLNQWIGTTTKSNIQELDLYIPSKKNSSYYLPQTVFTARTLTALRISGCKLGACNYINMSNLQKLCIQKIHIDEEIIQNLILGCPLIDDMRLIYCSGLKTLLLSSNRLNRVDIHCCHGLKKVEVKSPSLQTFWYHGKGSMRCNINLAMCKSLKSLTLEDANITDDLLKNQLSNFPVLEQLILSNCDALHCVTISSHQLKTLVLRGCDELREANIDTPNLLSFEYRGSKIPFSSLNPSGLREAKLYFEPSTLHNVDGSGFSFNKLQNFLRKFDCSKGLKFIVRSKENIIVHEDLRDILVPQVFDLKLEIIKSSMSLEDILDNLLRTWHPETLTIVSSTTSDFPEQVYKKMVDRGEEPSCCKYNSLNNKCWQHFLMDANIENLDDTEIESDWITWLKSSATMVNQLTCLRLNWKHR
ncbi:hypothetical protein GH714_035945 [Hevea brasiliensis]|uniref:F-box domain-containing protein n=1 Tax=Hevea brasiliensis TaxID=3981 RepID=A0A6A6NBI6_HEVBR|nr:hypothetical protein GH714_035945 [Hevea brasiliensis]